MHIINNLILGPHLGSHIQVYFFLMILHPIYECLDFRDLHCSKNKAQPIAAPRVCSAISVLPLLPFKFANAKRVSSQTFKIDENLTRSNKRYSTQNQNVVDGVHVRGSGDSDRKCRVKFIIKRLYRLLVHWGGCEAGFVAGGLGWSVPNLSKTGSMVVTDQLWYVRCHADHWRPPWANE